MLCRMKQCDDDSIGAYISHYAVKTSPTACGGPLPGSPLDSRAKRPQRGGQGRLGRQGSCGGGF